jgi:hypothetical protein
MDPHEKYERDLLWLMQCIKLEQFYAVDGKPIDFLLAKKTEGEKSELPNEDGQRKMLYKLQELKVLKLQPNSDPFMGAGSFNEPTRFLLTLEQDTFDGLYRSLETKYPDTNVEQKSPIMEPATYEQPVLKDKALEWIAEDLSTRNSHATLTEFLKELEIPAGAEQDGSKKVRALSVLRHLARSDKDKLFHLIEEAIHPLSFGTDEQKAKEMMDQYNNYLKYDGYQIILSNGSGPKVITVNADGGSIKTNGHLRSEQNKEKISLLRKAYQVLMGIVEVFCLDPANPDTQLNKFYLNTTKAIWDTIDELRLYGQFSTFKKPFSNLYAAEKEYGGMVSWDLIRPEMSAMFGQIETIYQEQDGSDILAEPDQQKQFNEIMLYLSELKEKARSKRDANKAEIPLVLYFSDDYGLYLDKGKKKPNYAITGKRAKLIQLLKNNKLSGQELCQLLDYTDQLLSKEVNEINNTFKDKLSQKHDLIIHLDTGGYALNKEQYQFMLEKQT